MDCPRVDVLLQKNPPLPLMVYLMHLFYILHGLKTKRPVLLYAILIVLLCPGLHDVTTVQNMVFG